MINKQIKELLLHSAQAGSPAPDYFSCFDDAVEEHSSTGPLQLQNLRSIYKVRAKINQSNGSPMAGHEELLYQMDTMQDEPVCISVFLAAAGRFVVFTDAVASKLVGVLFTPADKIAPVRTFQNMQST